MRSFTAAGSLPSRWIAVGVGAADAVLGPDTAGTFAGYGVDQRVTLSPGAGRHTHRTAAVCVDRGLGPRPRQARRARRGAGVRGRPQRRRRAGPRSPVARRDRRGGRSDRRPRRRRRRAHADPARARRLRPRLDTHTGRARRRARRRRCRRADPAARRHRRPGRLPGAGRAGRVSRPPHVRSRGPPRSSIAAHPTASATSPASGFRDGRPIAIIGPTGTGKSALALAVAERVGGEIVNADAMQQYRGMDIGTAKLSVSERRGIPHHQLDVLDVTETATVARYQQAAAADIEAIAGRGAVPIVVGGSMMYIQSLLDEWSFPATDACRAGQMGGAAGRDRCRRLASGARPGRRRRRRPRSCPPTAAASCGRWRSSSSPDNRSPPRRR